MIRTLTRIFRQIVYFLPFSRTRGAATGLTAALNYVLSFISTKIYYNLETTFSLPGITLFNCIVMAYGLILMYKILPETESRTLEDIEIHFADKSKNLTHHKIPKKSKQKQGKESDSSKVAENAISIISVEDKNKRQAGNGFTNSAFVEEHQHTKF